MISSYKQVDGRVEGGGVRVRVVEHNDDECVRKSFSFRKIFSFHLSCCILFMISIIVQNGIFIFVVVVAVSDGGKLCRCNNNTSRIEKTAKVAGKVKIVEVGRNEWRGDGTSEKTVA